MGAKRQLGHWDIGTEVGKWHRGVLVKIVERVTKFTLSWRALSKSAAHVTATAIALLASF